MKSTHGGKLLLVKFQVSGFSHFINCTNGTKLHKVSLILKNLSIKAKKKKKKERKKEKS